ncbi:MAG: CAP domain-containing protein [Armatimonadetes bacterium]|nr:CAP domain-containing protein [Armatimonadota bacterium]
MKRIVGVLVFFVVATSCVAAAQAQTVAPVTSAGMTPDEQLVLRLLNAERVDRDLLPLRFDPLLVKVARDHSRDMAERGYFAHVTPSPAETTPLQRYEQALGRKPEAVVGENIGYAEEPLMGLIHASLMKSPDHKANILDVEYRYVGVGVFAFPDGRVWVTQMFRGEEALTH